MDRFIGFLRAERACSEHTVRAYCRILAELSAELPEGRALATATRLDLRAYLSHAGGAPATVAQRIAAMRAYFRWAMREGLVTEDPTERLARPRVRSSLPRVLEVGEAAALVENVAGGEPAHQRNEAILELAYGSGLRVSELSALNAEDLDLVEGLVHVRRGKGGKDRRVPVGPPALAALQGHLGGRRNGPVFLNPAGTRLGVRSIHTIVHRSGVKNGLAGVHPHAMRHSFATHLLKNGADIRSIQEMLGHASLSTTQRYAAVDLGRLRETWTQSHPLSEGSPLDTDRNTLEFESVPVQRHAGAGWNESR